MSHKKHKGGGHDDVGHGGDRPWVYFMIDAFFLVTQFFVLTFKVKVDEVVLPQRLPPGGSMPSKSTALQDNKKKLTVHVTNNGGQASYSFMQKEVNLSGLQDMLAGSVGAGQEYQVRVSYEPDVHFGAVLAVFNACAKMKINECGLIPLRGAAAGPG